MSWNPHNSETPLLQRRKFVAVAGGCLAQLCGCGRRVPPVSDPASAKASPQTSQPGDIEDAAQQGTPAATSSTDLRLDPVALRSSSRQRLERLGFVVDSGLPLWEQFSVRPKRQIVHRLMALDAVYTWAYANEYKAASERVRTYVERNRLVDMMTAAEREIIKSPRPAAQQTHERTIGWLLENMWPLAWTLGFAPEPVLPGEIITESVANQLMMKFMPRLDETVDGLAAAKSLRPVQEIAELHDFYFCAHCVVDRASSMGKTLPNGFDLDVGGLTIAERRHALTWTLSAGVSWEDIDLNT